MTALEWRASTSLASLFALRMLGMFLILPVFAVHAETLPGGDNLALVGIAIGMYGLTQAILQVPFGMASDKYGRKRVIVFGLLVFAAGSFVAAVATDIYWVIIGRALQGAGAISAAVVAFLADLTRDEHRTKAMAMTGASIGLMFALSLAVAPWLYALVGMGGLFSITGLLALAGIFVTWKIVPPEPPAVDSPHVRDPQREVRASVLRDVLVDPELARLYFGIFVLQAMQVALFVVVPIALVEAAGLALRDHWLVYLPVVLASFVLMVPIILWGERRAKLKAMLLGAVATMLVVQVGFLWSAAGAWSIAFWLLVYFVAFNVLEATLPSLVSRYAPAAARGTAIGVFNTLMALGIFAGGAIGGTLMSLYGKTGIFVFGIALVALWLLVAVAMRSPASRPGGTLTPSQVTES
jgi:MFS family permease